MWLRTPAASVCLACLLYSLHGGKTHDVLLDAHHPAGKIVFYMYEVSCFVTAFEGAYQVLSIYKPIIYMLSSQGKLR